MPSSGPGRVYVGRLPRNCYERDLERHFRRFGRVRDIIIKNNYGFLQFDDARDAEDAVYELNGRDFMGTRLVVEMARANPYTKDSWLKGYEVTIENLSTRVSWQELKQMMLRYDVLRADVEPAKRRGLCYFARRKDAEKAIEKYDGKEINGRDIQMKITNEPKSVSRSRSKSSSRSRSRSPKRKSRSRSGSRSRSRSPKKDKRSKRSKSRDSKSRSKSPADDEKTNGVKEDGAEAKTETNDKEDGRKRSRSGSDRSRSGSPSTKKVKSEEADGDAGRKSRSRSRSGSK